MYYLPCSVGNNTQTEESRSSHVTHIKYQQKLETPIPAGNRARRRTKQHLHLNLIQSSFEQSPASRTEGQANYFRWQYLRVHPWKRKVAALRSNRNRAVLANRTKRPKKQVAREATYLVDKGTRVKRCERKRTGGRRNGTGNRYVADGGGGLVSARRQEVGTRKRNIKERRKGKVDPGRVRECRGSDAYCNERMAFQFLSMHGDELGNPPCFPIRGITEVVHGDPWYVKFFELAPRGLAGFEKSSAVSREPEGGWGW